MPGHIQVANFPAGFGPSCWGEKKAVQGGKLAPMAFGCFCASSLFSADQFVVSVLTKVSGAFNKTKVFFGGGRGGGGGQE